MKYNTEKVKKYLIEIIKSINVDMDSPFKGSIKNSIMSDKTTIPQETKDKLRLLYGKYYD
jgi:hypothetical protein